jgi:chemotaxis protein histidine kinase CheA
MEDDQDVVREFLVESNENLSRLDRDLVELETRPQDAELLASVFRTIHTIKGTCGFLGFSTLERITHQAESLLSQLRDGRRKLEPGLVSLILETVDATRKVLSSIESTGKEGPEQFKSLAERLRDTAERNDLGAAASAKGKEEGDSAERHIEYVHGTPVYRRRGKLLPISYLNEVVGLKADRRGDAVSIVVLQAEDRQYGLVVDGISDTQEIVVKPLGKQLKGLSLYAGATIMGDGRVALILDVQGIGQASGVLEETQEQGKGASEGVDRSEVEQHRLLLCKAGSYERIAIPLSLVARLEEFPRSSIERAGNAMVVQYRQRILPLVVLRSLLENGNTQSVTTADPAQVIVFDDGDQRLGIVVDQILDIAEQAITVRQRSTHKGFLGSAVVGTRVADFLDVDHVLQSSAARWFQGSSATGKEKTVLLADRSTFARGLTRGALEMSGYAVVEAGNLDEAVRGLEKHAVDAVLIAEDLPPHGAGAVVNAMRRRPEWEQIPVMDVAAWDKPRNANTAKTGEIPSKTTVGGQGGILDFLSGLHGQEQPEPAGAAPRGKE